MKASVWAFDRMKEAFELVAPDGTEKDERCARDHAHKHGLLVAGHCASWRTMRSHNVIPVPELQQSSFWKTTFGGSLGENIQSGGAQFVERSTIGSNHTGC